MGLISILWGIVAMIWMVLARMDGKAPADMEEARTWAMENAISDGTNPTTNSGRLSISLKPRSQREATAEQIIERLKTQSLGLQKQRDDLLSAAGLEAPRSAEHRHRHDARRPRIAHQPPADLRGAGLRRPQILRRVGGVHADGSRWRNPGVEPGSRWFEQRRSGGRRGTRTPDPLLVREVL